MLYVLGGADMLNRSAELPVGDNDVQLRRSEATGEQLLVVRACKDFKAGEQAFFSYGDASNGRLLMMAGFVVADNPFDAVELMLTFPVTPESLPCYLTLSEGLDAGLRTPGSAVAEETKAEFLDMLSEAEQPIEEGEQPAKVALHVRLSQKALLAQLERVLAFLRLQQVCRGGAPTADALAASDVDPSSRSNALKSLQGALYSMQKGYPRSLEEDEAELFTVEAAAKEGDAKARRKAMGLKLLIGEKRIFLEALILLEQKLKES